MPVLKADLNWLKWVSNSQSVLASIPKSKANQMKELDLDREKLPVERALGIQWNIENDTFTFQINVKSQPVTRGFLSMVSSVYDPFGFLSPFVVKAKPILQELCRMKFGWDEAIPENLAKPWFIINGYQIWTSCPLFKLPDPWNLSTSVKSKWHSSVTLEMQVNLVHTAVNLVHTALNSWIN